MNRKKAKNDAGPLPSGTVVAIPVTKGKWTVGQILEQGVVFYLGVDPTVLSEVPSDPCSIDFRPRIFAMTTDGEIFKGKWKVIGRCQIMVAEYPRPNYKVYREGKLKVVSFDGEILRDFLPGEDDNLQFRSSQSPLLVQDAIQALAGAGEWHQIYEKLVPAGY